MKKILFIASEAVPFIKTGGLADVVGSLPKCFDKEQYTGTGAQRVIGWCEMTEGNCRTRLGAAV